MSDRQLPLTLRPARHSDPSGDGPNILNLRPRASHAGLQTTAYHEAGHAAAVILSGGTYRLRGISLRERFAGPPPERYRHTGAHLTIEPQAKVLELLNTEQRPRAEALLVIVMAGTVADRFLLRQRHRECAFRHELSCHGLYALLHFHGSDCLPEYRRWLQARAVHLVACPWRGISRLAAALAEYQDLSGQEAERFLMGRC